MGQTQQPRRSVLIVEDDADLRRVTAELLETGDAIRAGRAWHIAYTSPNLAGVQAAISAGLGVSILSAVAILADHQILRAKDGFPAVGDTELALVAAPDASPATRRLADVLAEFCAGASPRAAA